MGGCGKRAAEATRTPDEVLGAIEARLVSGNLRLAQDEAETAVRRFDSGAGGDGRFAVELARIHLYKGENAEAIALLDREPSARLVPEWAIRRRLARAFAELRLGDKRKADRELAAAGELHPTGRMLAEYTGTRGSMALEQGDLVAAGRFFQTALADDQASGSSFHAVQMMMNLGVVALSLEHFEEALAHFQGAAALAQSLGAAQALEKAIGNQGRVYYQTGEFERARELSDAAARQAHALEAPVDELIGSTNAGKSAYAEQDYAAAKAFFVRSLALAETLHNTNRSLNAEVALAYVLLQQDANQAEAHIAEAKRLAALGQDRSEDLEPLLLEALLRKQQGRSREAESLLLALVRQSRASPSFAWEAQTMLASLYAGTHEPVAADRWFQRALNTFHTQRLSLESLELQLPFLGNGTRLYGGYVDFLVEQHRAGEALRLLDASRAETLTEGLGKGPGAGPGSMDPRALAARLGATLLVYSLQPGRSYLWAIDARHLQIFPLPGSEAVLPVVARHNAAILASKDLLTQSDSTGRALYDALLAPAAALLPRGGRVLLLPGDGLSRLNFETLIPAGPDTHYWVEDATITQARSLRLLSERPADAAERSQSLLLVGDPVYRPAEYPALPNAAAEMVQVAAHFPERTILAGAEATPAAYASTHPGGFGYLHVVAHATARETTPLDSAIILSHPGAGGSEKLYAAEVLKQPLRARLVTLSSCYGTGTRIYSGEGLVGLVWAFLRAGAHGVIGAQWEVSDVAAPQLMDTLYTRLLQGDAPDTALRSAKLTLLHRGGVFRKPLYWAAFQLYAGR